MADVYSSGLSGINAAQTALATIAHNIANANTPGYARQTVSVTPQAAVKTGAGFLGSGTMVDGVFAKVDNYLEGRLTAATSASSGSSALDLLYARLEQTVAGAQGVGAAMGGFNSALAQAATNPSAIATRQMTLANANALSNSIQSVATQIIEQRATSNQDLQDATAQANVLLKQIATLNDQIASVETPDKQGNIDKGAQANDLRSQRQVAINELSKYVDVTAIPQNEGVTIMSNGQALVISNKAAQLTTSADPLDPSKLTVGIQSQAGPIYLDATKMGGSIGATATFIKEGLDVSMAQLNQYAGVIAYAVNDQMQKGVDWYGNQGVPLFNADATKVMTSSRNTGSLSLSVSVSPMQTQGSDYQLNYTTGNVYQVTRLSDNTVVASGATLPLSVDGITINSTGGTVNPGDTFLIKPFGDSAGVFKPLYSDPKLLAFASPVAGAAALTNTGSGTISQPTVVSGLPLNPNLKSTVSITFTSPTTYDISGPGIGTLTGQAYTQGAAISYNGWSAQISGVPKTGDSFSIQAASGNIGDGSNANVLLGTMETKSFAGGAQSLADFTANMQSYVGSKASIAKTTAKSDQGLLQIAHTQRESYSGVNLDEEAADLTRWQQIYAANAQIMSTAQKLFEDLLSKF